MAENFWEQGVEIYLAIDRGVFISPQYLIGEPKGWKAYADFLALSFPDRTAWMVEVTTNPAKKLSDKVSQFEAEYSPRIRNQLVEHKVLSADAGWQIGLWPFVPEAWEAQVEEWLRKANVAKYRVTTLNNAVFPDWDSRFR